MESPKISIICPFRNEEKVIDPVLQSFVAQDYSNKEVILLDDESDDGSPEIAKNYASKYPWIKYYRIKKKPNTWATDAYIAAISKATGDYVYMADANCALADSTFFVKVVEHFKKDKERKLAGVVPFLRIMNPQTWIAKHRAVVYDEKYNNFEKVNEHVNMGKYLPQLFSMKAYQEVGGFDRNVRWAIDNDLSRRMLEKGFSLVYDPDIKVEHKFVDELIPLMKYQFKFGRMNVGQVKYEKDQYYKMAYFLSLFPLIGLSLYSPQFLPLLLLHPVPLIGNGLKLFMKCPENEHKYYALLSPVISYVQNISYAIGHLYGRFIEKY